MSPWRKLRESSPHSVLVTLLLFGLVVRGSAEAVVKLPPSINH